MSPQPMDGGHKMPGQPTALLHAITALTAELAEVKQQNLELLRRLGTLELLLPQVLRQLESAV